MKRIMKRLHGRIVIATLALFAEAFAVDDVEASDGERSRKTSLRLPVLTVRQRVSGKCNTTARTVPSNGLVFFQISS